MVVGDVEVGGEECVWQLGVVYVQCEREGSEDEGERWVD